MPNAIPQLALHHPTAFLAWLSLAVCLLEARCCQRDGLVVSNLHHLHGVSLVTYKVLPVAIFGAATWSSHTPTKQHAAQAVCQSQYVCYPNNGLNRHPFAVHVIGLPCWRVTCSQRCTHADAIPALLGMLSAVSILGKLISAQS